MHTCRICGGTKAGKAEISTRHASMLMYMVIKDTECEVLCCFGPDRIMSFKRRRVALACTYCRHRKRRCDARKPRCEACIEAEVDCQYDDGPTERIDSSGGTREILTRLGDIEALLQEQSDSLAALSLSSRPDVQVPGGQLPPARGNAYTTGSPESRTSAPAAYSPSTGGQVQLPDNHPSDTSIWMSVVHGTAVQPQAPAQTPSTQADIDLSSAMDPMTIPVHHLTSSSYLLGLRMIKALVGEYPPNLFSLLESRTPLPAQLCLDGWGHTSSPLPDFYGDRATLDSLVESFFSIVYPCHPFLDRAVFDRLYEAFFRTGPENNIETALCMAVFALGAASSHVPMSHEQAPAGAEFMQFALPILTAKTMWSFAYDERLVQALSLASVYFAYIIRPLHSWRLIYMAATNLQFRLTSHSNRDICDDEPTLRLFWSAFTIECDRLAELELPRSGLGPLTDVIGLPALADIDSIDSTCFLAEVSIRRLLNRVHDSLYAPGTAAAATAFGHRPNAAVCAELHRQLDLWHVSIPAACRPPLDQATPAANDRVAVLRIRYFAARHIIYRPFVLAVAAQAATSSPPSNTPVSAAVKSPVSAGFAGQQAVVDHAAMCIESCRRYLLHTAEILDRPSQYTWTFSVSSLGAVITLTMAWLCPELSHLVPDIDELQGRAIANIRPWGGVGSSLGEVISILEDMQRKTRFKSRT